MSKRVPRRKPKPGDDDLFAVAKVLTTRVSRWRPWKKALLAVGCLCLIYVIAVFATTKQPISRMPPPRGLGQMPNLGKK
jgi:hypothetical protein